MEETIQIRSHGPVDAPVLIYLPGTHGDWTLATSLRRAIGDRVRFVEFTYPRTTTWSLEDYAQGVERALLDHGVTRGWLLGESFSSQVCWQMLASPTRKFQTEGVILAGGFVRYPVMFALRLARRLVCGLPMRQLNFGLRAYRIYALLRHWGSPEVRVMLNEFMARRTDEDRRAASHRLDLIEANDLRDVARATRVPVFCLAGLVDPIVPWPFVHPWLPKNCPGFRERKIAWSADHNVLNMAPEFSAETILRWMKM